MSSTAKTDGPATLESIRGALRKARANARTVAALTRNPGCTRRRVIDAAGVRAHELAERLGHRMVRGQSPFAITSGNLFEDRLKQGSDYALLREVLMPYVDLPADGLRVRDLGGLPGTPGTAWLRARARQTEQVLASIARGDEDAPHIVDHPVLVFDLAGTDVFLEPDALAFRVGTRLELVEIKSYPIIDGQADPSKLSATGGQAAVYVLALRATLRRMGFDPDLIEPSVILVAPRNFSRAAVAHRIPLRKEAMALDRVLRGVPKTEALLAGLPEDFTLDLPGGRALDAAVRRLPMLYVPDCLSSCDMGRFCRHQALVDDDPSRLGRAARDNLAGVGTLGEALRIARGEGEATGAHAEDVGEALRIAYGALTRARARAPAPSGLGSAGTGGRR